MTKFPLSAAATAVLLLAGCAGQNANDQSSASSNPTAAPAAAAPRVQAGAYTDAQLRAYAAAKAEIEPLQANLASQTPEQQQQTSAQIAAVLQRHNIEATTFNAIARMANEDRTFAARLAAIQPDTFSDDSLRAFARASIEIQPITDGLAAATPEQRTQATEQIRQILERNNLDSATYNAIAARAQTDQALVARIQELHRQAQTQNEAN